MTARKETALRRKEGAIPAVAISTPAAAGPSSRPVLNMALLRATALAISSGPTISMTNAWRVGMSIMCTTPSRNASPYTIHSRADPVATRRPMTSASTAGTT